MNSFSYIVSSVILGSAMIACGGADGAASDEVNAVESGATTCVSGSGSSLAPEIVAVRTSYDRSILYVDTRGIYCGAKLDAPAALGWVRQEGSTFIVEKWTGGTSAEPAMTAQIRVVNVVNGTSFFSASKSVRADTRCQSDYPISTYQGSCLKVAPIRCARGTLLIDSGRLIGRLDTTDVCSLSATTVEEPQCIDAPRGWKVPSAGIDQCRYETGAIGYLYTVL